MKVFIVSQYFWPENFRINDLTCGLVERGHEVCVLTGTPNYPAGRFFKGYGLFQKTIDDYHGAKIIRVPIVPRGNGSEIQLALNYFSFALISTLFAVVLSIRRFDIVFVCQLSPVTVGIPAVILKKLTRVPIVYWILDLWPESLSAAGAATSKYVFSFVDRVVRFIYRGCDRILVGSKGFIPSVVSRGVEQRRIEYFPNWYEPEYRIVQRSCRPAISRLLPSGFRVMFAGNIGVAQNFECILNAAEKLRNHVDIHWIVLGEGRKLQWVKEEVLRRDLTTNFHTLGRYEAAEMPDFFSQADAMLVTLRRDPMFAITVPGKIQSYMACAKPVIAALDGEGVMLIEEAEAGLTSPAEDSDALAANVLRMYGMPKEDREAMGRRGRQYCEMHFDRDILIDKLDLWMKEVVIQKNIPLAR